MIHKWSLAVGRESHLENLGRLFGGESGFKTINGGWKPVDLRRQLDRYTILYSQEGGVIKKVKLSINCVIHSNEGTVSHHYFLEVDFPRVSLI